MRSFRILIVLVLLAGVSTATWRYLHRARPLPVSPVTITSTPSKPAPAVPVPPVKIPEPPEKPVVVTPAVRPAEPVNHIELVGTAQMVAAHSSLRMPEVADPDSNTNRQILQVMVAKALNHSSGQASALPHAP
jgi:hypothetical protein